MTTVAAAPFIAALIDERDRALSRNRELEEAMQAAHDVLMCVCEDAKERHDAAIATIQRLSNEAEQLANENDRLRTLVKDAYAVFVQCGATLPYMDYLRMIGETRADMEAVIEETNC